VTLKKKGIMDEENRSLILLNESQFSYLEKMIDVNDESVVVVGINPDLTFNQSTIVAAATALDGEADNILNKQQQSPEAGK